MNTKIHLFKCYIFQGPPANPTLHVDSEHHALQKSQELRKNPGLVKLNNQPTRIEWLEHRLNALETRADDFLQHKTAGQVLREAYEQAFN